MDIGLFEIYSLHNANNFKELAPYLPIAAWNTIVSFDISRFLLLPGRRVYGFMVETDVKLGINLDSLLEPTF